MGIAGDKEFFAIEFKIDSYVDKYVFGFIKFWINGIAVGDFEELVTISITVSYLEQFLQQGGVNVYKGSEKLNKDCLFYELHDVFIADITPPLNCRKFEQGYSLNIGEFREKYWLDEIGEDSFRDKISCVILHEPILDRERIVWKDLKEELVFEGFIPKGMFVAVVKTFLENVNDNLQRLL